MKKLIFNSKEELEIYKKNRIDSIRERSILWQKNNKEKAYLNHKKYRDKNRDSLNKKAILFRETNREEVLVKRRINSKERKLKEPNFKFSENLRSLISGSFKRGDKKFIKTLKTEQILGCSISFFVEYILSKCPKNVEIKDFHRFGYQLDHIIPISSAKTEEEIIKLCHYTNFQPLWWRDNIVKSNKK